MYTKPDIGDLLHGVRSHLGQVLTPYVQDSPEAQGILDPVLGVLARVEAEWAGVAARLSDDSVDIVGTLSEIADMFDGDPALRERLRQVLHIARQSDSGTSCTAIASVNDRLKGAIVDYLDILDLPAAPDAAGPVAAADRAVQALLSRMSEREVACPVATSVNLSGRQANAPEPLDAMARRLESFVAGQVYGDEAHSDAVTVSSLVRQLGGGSRDTYFFDLAYTAPDGGTFEAPCVLQSEAASSVLESDDPETGMTGSRRTPEVEYEVIRIAAAHGIQAPEMLWLEPTGQVLGTKFFISRRGDGAVDDAELREEHNHRQREDVATDFVRTMARIHAIDVDAAGLGILGDPTVETAAAQQVEQFAEGYERQRLEVIPVWDYLVRWLRKNLPVALKVSLIHGDYRRGNFLWQDDRVSLVVDWEQAHLGDALEEIAFAYWHMWNADCLIPLDDFVVLYEQERGITIDRAALAFYRMFIELKMAVVILTSWRSFFATEVRQLQYAMFPGGSAERCRTPGDAGAHRRPTVRLPGRQGRAPLALRTNHSGHSSPRHWGTPPGHRGAKTGHHRKGIPSCRLSLPSRPGARFRSRLRRSISLIRGRTRFSSGSRPSVCVTPTWSPRRSGRP